MSTTPTCVTCGTEDISTLAVYRFGSSNSLSTRHIDEAHVCMTCLDDNTAADAGWEVVTSTIRPAINERRVSGDESWRVQF